MTTLNDLKMRAFRADGRIGTHNDMEMQFWRNIVNSAGSPIDVPDGITISDGFLNVGTVSELTIVAGVITVTSTSHTVDTQSDDATDDLDTISGGTAGDVLFLSSADSARDVVVKDGTGNLLLAGDTDFTLATTDDVILLWSDGTNWREVSRSAVGGGASQWVLLATDTFTDEAAPTLDWTSPADHTEIRVTIEDLTTDTDDSQVLLKARQSSATIVSADQGFASFYKKAGVSSSVANSSTATAIGSLTSSAAGVSLGNAAGEGGQFTLTAQNPGSTALSAAITHVGNYVSTDGNAIVVEGGGTLLTNTLALDGIALAEASGALLSGVMRAYGLKKA